MLYRHQEYQEIVNPELLVDKWGHQYIGGFFPDGESFYRVSINFFEEKIDDTEFDAFSMPCDLIIGE